MTTKLNISEKTWELIEKQYQDSRKEELELERKFKKGTITYQEKQELNWLNGFNWGMAKAMNLIENRTEE